MEKTGMLKNLIVADRFCVCCEELARAVNLHLFNGERTISWVEDEVGGICDFGYSDFLNPVEMVRILKSGMTHDEYTEWRDANLENDGYINLDSWLIGFRHEMMKKHND